MVTNMTSMMSSDVIDDNEDFADVTGTYLMNLLLNTVTY